MDRCNSGGGEYGHAAAGAGDYRSKDRGGTARHEEGADGGRWQNDMYEDTSGTKRDKTHEPHGGSGGDWGEGGYRDKGKWDNSSSGARNGRHGKGGRGTRGRDRGRGYGDGGHGAGWRDSDRHRDEGYRDSHNWSSNARGGDDAAQGWGDAEGGDGHVDSEDGGAKGGSERWRKYAETMSARAGIGHARRHDYGHGHDYGHRSQGKPEITSTSRREQGRVCSMKDSFGFIRCVDRPGDLFFHVREAPSSINIGDEVEFFVGVGDRSGKDCALQLNVLPPGTVSSEVVLDATFLGVIERDTRSGPSSMGRSRYQEYGLQQLEGLIKIISGKENTKSSTSGGISTGDYDLKEENAVANDDDDDDSGDSKSKGAPLGLTGAMVTYVAADVMDGDEDASYSTRLRRGDEVRFKVSQAKVTGRKRAVDVMLVRTGREKREQEQLQKLTESGASRHQGVVKKLTPDFGFLQSLSCPDSIYFSTADISTNEAGRVRVGAQAEFWVVPDRTKDNRESLRALGMTLLPPGSFATEEEIHQAVRGVVQRAPTVPQRQTNYGGGGMQPGVARFSIPCSVTEDDGSAGEASPVMASLIPKELGKGHVSSLEVGDEIEADLWRSKLGGGKTVAKNVALVRFGGERVSGIVRTLRDGGFGFIRPLGEGEDVYFRLADIAKNNEGGDAPELHEGSEVMMTVKDAERQGEKKRATRIQILPKGTLELEVTLAKGVMGVVSRDAKGAGQGMITVIDGNSLEVPLSVRFPKVARQVREFAEEDRVKGKGHLVFPRELTTSEKMAVRTLAVEAGLVCRTDGEDLNQSLHVSKPKSEEDAVAIKEAEAKRVDENLKAAKDRSKNAERSLSVPFHREDVESGEQDATTEADCGIEASSMRGEEAQDFRRERGYSTVAHRGDLVTFDVVLDRGSMKRRGTNVRVTKRAGQVSDNNAAEDTDTALSREKNEDEREHLGIVTLVQVERHYGFIDMLGTDGRVFFHLSDVLPDDAFPKGEGGVSNGESTKRVRKGQEVIIRRGQEVAFYVGQRQGKPLGMRVRKLPAGSLPTEETVPGSFVGVVVVPPRNVGITCSTEDKDALKLASPAEMEGVLVLLQETAAKVGDSSTSTREAEKEISKAHRMLSSAGLRVTSLSQDPQAVSAVQPSGIFPSKRPFSLGKGQLTGLKGPPLFSLLRFLIPCDTSENVPTDGCDAMAASSLSRGDLVEFVVAVRRGQRQFSQRVRSVSLLTKAALPCRRGQVVKLDPKAGVAHVDLLRQETGTGAALPSGDESNIGPGDEGGRVFFLLKEMVGAAGPVRIGDEVDLVLPASSTSRQSGGRNPPGVHAVGAVRVQDLKSLSGARQRVNLDLRDSQKGQPQVRMAQGPDGAGFRPGHRPTRSLYAPDGSCASETTAAKATDGTVTGATVMA